MSDRIPANARQYIKQVRANRQKQKQKQSNKQTTTVIINQEPKRRRAPNKPKSAPSSGGGGGGGGPSVIPYVIPQTQLTAASYQNSAVQPANEIQQLTQALSQFQQNQNQIYRNPFRMEPFRTAMNPAPLQQVEEPLPEPIQERPNPVMPDIVLQPNRVEQVARPQVAFPIVPSTPIYEGFAINQAQISREQEMELDAILDMGGYDAQSPREPSQAEYQQELIRQQEKLKEFMSSGGGGGEQLARRSNKGRPFSDLTESERRSIELAIYAKKANLVRNRQFLDGLNPEDKESYERGLRLISQNKKNNPSVIAYIQQLESEY